MKRKFKGQHDWEQRYEDGDLPWDTGRADVHLVNTVLGMSLPPGQVLEVGCGTGTNAIWLDKQGWEVVAVDISEKAIEQAWEKADEAGFEGIIQKADVLKDPIPCGPYQLVFDRGCLHSIDAPKDRRIFSEKIHQLSASGGLWLSIMGSCDDEPRDTGPPMLSVAEIADAIEPWFEILSLTATYFDSNSTKLPKAWKCLARKRVLEAGA